MKKRYLSSNERKQLITTASALKTLDQTIEELASRGREKNLLKELRMAKSFMDRAVTAWMQVMPKPEMEAMAKQARNYQMILALKSEVKTQRAQALKETTVIPVDLEEFMGLVEAAVYKCTECDGTCKKDCVLYRVQLKHEIPPYQTVSASVCPYAYKAPIVECSEGKLS